MQRFDWSKVGKENVLEAIEQFVNENPEFPEAKSTFLLYNGKKLPAKHIRGMAYKVAHGVSISKDDYSGGLETKRFFENLGFEIYYTGRREQNASGNDKKEKSVKPANSQDK